jgi:hypothetical protein
MKPDLNVVLSRLFASLIVPGFIATAPFVWCLQETKYQHAVEWLLSGSLPASAVGVLIVFSASLIMEQLGSSLEWLFWTKANWKKCSGPALRDEEWYEYLMTETVPPIMSDHISHLVSRLKWALNGGPAFIIGACAPLLLALQKGFTGCQTGAGMWYYVSFISLALTGVCQIYHGAHESQIL